MHILVILLVPTYSEQNAWSQISKLGEPYKFYDLTNLQRINSAADPYFIEAACRFELKDHAVHVSSEKLLPFWSLSIYNRQGDNLLNFNDTISNHGDLNLIIAPPILAEEIRQSLSESQSNSVLVEQDINDGIITLRALVPDESWRVLATETLDKALCKALR
ncbi:hypothetical protein ACLBWZ_04405 [Brucellaceae bacterium C25G]